MPINNPKTQCERCSKSSYVKLEAALNDARHFFVNALAYGALEEVDVKKAAFILKGIEEALSQEATK